MGARPEKLAIVDEIRGAMEKAPFTILADCRGLSVEGITDLRGRLRTKNSRLVIAKNTFIGLASAEVGWVDVDSFLNGPTGVITGEGEITEVARLLKDFIKETNRTRVKGGRLGGTTLSAEDMEALATIPPREVLLGQVVGTIAAPMGQLVGVLNQKLCSLLYALKAVAEKKTGNA